MRAMTGAGARGGLAALLGGAILGFVVLPTAEALALPRFIRGDATADGRLSLADPVAVLYHAFLGRAIDCEDAADANDDGAVDIADGLTLLELLFVGGEYPASPFPDCGLDPTPDSLSCERFDICDGGEGVEIDARGGQIELTSADGDLVSVRLSQGLLEFPSRIVSSFAWQPAPLLDAPDSSALATVRLRLDSVTVDSSTAASFLQVDLPLDSPALAREPQFLADATVFVRAGDTEYFHALTVEPAVDDAGQAVRRVVVPGEVFQRAREWSLVGRTTTIDLTPVTIEEVSGQGEVILTRDGRQLNGTVEFTAESEAHVQTLLDNVVRTVSFSLPAQEIELDVVFGWVEEVYARVDAALDAMLGDGRLFRFAPSIGKLQTPDEFLPGDGFALGEHAPIVLVHGWDLADPFLDMYSFTPTTLEFRRIDPPGDLPVVQEALLTYWRQALEHIAPSASRSVYIYAYNAVRGSRHTTATLDARMEEILGWTHRTDPVTFVCQSTGAHVVISALQERFGLVDALPPQVRVVALQTPFRGTPLATPAFHTYGFENDLAPLLDVSHSLWRLQDLHRRRLFPRERIASLAGAATFLRTLAPGARELDLDALWSTLRSEALDGGLFVVASELDPESARAPWPQRVLARLLGEFEDALGRRPYARSDGIVPIASALRRRGAASEFWFEIDSSSQPGRERIATDVHHGALPRREETFEALELGAGTRTTSIGLELRYVPPSTYQRGSPLSETGRDSDETRHEVTLTRGFYLGETEITQQQYLAVTETNPSFFRNDPQSGRYPVESVNWQQALAFCCVLTEHERRAGTIGEDEAFRLPTEAEWELACRGGTTTPFSFGVATSCSLVSCSPCAVADANLWWCGNSDGRPRPVELSPPNPLGFRGLHGNVSEWCLDRYDSYPDGSVVDPSGPQSGSLRVLRGGSWFTDQLRSCRSAWRGLSTPFSGGTNIGLRVALVLVDAAVPPPSCP